jgi:polysaccharide biosynthesis/export protein
LKDIQKNKVVVVVRGLAARAAGNRSWGSGTNPTKFERDGSSYNPLNFMRYIFLLLITASAINGCSLELASTNASGNYGVLPDSQSINENSNTGSLTADADSLIQESVIRSGDNIQLTVWGYPKFNTTATVGANGTITIPLVGEVIVAGLTVRQLSAELRQRLSEYVKGDVKLTLSHVGTDEHISVMGSVSRQGNYPAQTERSLVDVLADAGGVTTTANLDAIKIFRRGIHSSVSTVNLTEYLRSGNIQYVPRVGPGDVVFVPEQPNFIRDFSVYAGEVVFLFGFFALLR